MSRSELFTDAVVKKPMLYTSPGFWAGYGDMTKAEYWLQFPLWVAHYTTSMTPQLPCPGHYGNSGNLQPKGQEGLWI